MPRNKRLAKGPAPSDLNAPPTGSAATVKKISDLTPDARNANKGSLRGNAVIADSLRRYGAGRSILLDRHGAIIAGNKTAENAGAIGMEDVLVVQTTGDRLVAVQRMDLDLDSPAARELAIADNRASEVSLSWDTDVLKGLVSDGVDLAPFWTPDELTEFWPVQLQGDEDDVPPVPATPVTKLGDMWLLGEHRLLCGDSTRREDVERLMNGERAGLMNTDPPYGIAYANDDRPNPGVAKPRVANDELADEKLQQFLESAFHIAKTVALKENAAWYLWHAHLTQGYFAAAAAAAAAAAVILHRQIIWVKPVLLLGRGHYHWKHEPCFMGWVKGQQPPDYGLGHGERTQTTVWEVGSISHAERKEFNHSSPKPVGLFDIPIIKHLRQHEIAYEPFAGSGPQIIAAEKAGRRCFSIELDPAFCDVIRTRWEQATGKKATLDGTATKGN